jgi:hypothetical protein
LERPVTTADRIADVVRAVDEAVDLIFKAHRRYPPGT